MLLRPYAGLLVSVLAAGCGACASAPALPDAGKDAGHDAGRDARADGGVQDAGRDATADAGPGPEWTALPEHETGCVIEYARNPQAVYAPSWVSCPADMPAGCEQLEMPYGAFTRVQMTDDGLRFIVVLPPESAGGRLIALATRDVAVMAVRSPGPGASCTTGFEAASESRAVFTTWTETDARHYDERHYVVSQRTNTWGPPVARVNRLKATAARQLEISSSTYIAVLSASLSVEVYEAGGSNALRGLGIPQATFLVGRDVLWEDWTDGYVVRVYHGAVDRPGAVFFASPDGSDLKGFATDGIDMAWTQAYGPRPDGVTFDRYELWTAAYVTEAALIAPRRVAIEPYEGVGAVGSGWYMSGATVSGPQQFVRLADGARKRIPAPGDGFEYDQRPVLGNGYVAMPASRRAPARFESTLFVVPIDAIPDV